METNTVKKVAPFFGGELFPKRENRNFEKAHLKAFIKGHEFFNYGFRTVKNFLGTEMREPAEHRVKREWREVTWK